MALFQESLWGVPGRRGGGGGGGGEESGGRGWRGGVGADSMCMGLSGCCDVCHLEPKVSTLNVHHLNLFMHIIGCTHIVRDNLLM